MGEKWKLTEALGSNEVETEYHVVKSWESFTDIFGNAKEVKAMTYCDSPKIIREILDVEDEIDVESLEVVVGDRDSDAYRAKLTNHVDEAYRMKKLMEEDRLHVYTLDTSRSILHTKLYRIVQHDGTHKLVLGSANLSRQAWRNTKQTNTVVVHRTSGNTELDEIFAQMYDHQKKQYTEEFMSDLISELEDVETSEEEREKISAWVDGRVGEHDEVTELNKKATEELDNVDVEVQLLTDEEGEADKKVTFSEDVREADEVIEERISLSTNGFDSGKSAFEGLRDYDNTTIKDDVIRTTNRAYTQYLREEYGIPKMWFSRDDGALLMDGPSHRHRLTADTLPESPDVVNEALENLERYFETVETHGDSNDYEAVKAHMFEGIIWFFWAPFVNKHASKFRNASLELDDALPFLYIYGESNAGKGTFAKFALSLISHSVVEEPADADEIGKRQIRGLKTIDSTFPLVVDDITKNKIDQSLDGPLRNYWKDWPGDIQYPSIAFISNDKRPNKWFRNRSKILHFDIFFEGNFKSRRDVAEVIDQKNPLFEWFTHQMLNSEMKIPDSTDSLEIARNVFKNLYEYADRELPPYFPEKPADEHYDTAKGKWHRAHDRNQIEFEEYNGHIIAAFDEDMSFDVKSYCRSLPTRMRAEAHGLEIEIKHVDNFIDWFGENPVGEKIEEDDSEDSPGIISRIGGSLLK